MRWLWMTYMTNLTFDQRRHLAMARKRPLSKRLGELTDHQIKQLANAYYQYAPQQDLNEAIHSRRARNLPIGDKTYLLQHYQQVNFYLNEQLIDACCADLHASITNLVGPCRRIRIAQLDAKAHIPEHIDDPHQHRVIALLTGQHIFSINQNNHDHVIPMQMGELWYINSAWPHKVVNPHPYPRLALLLDLEAAP